MAFTFSEVYPEMRSQLQIEIEKVLFSEQSEFQRIDIVQTHSYGRMLVIDGFVMLTEHDEFVYHEMISHVPLLTHPSPRQVLVIGGGDGGTVRECLRHETVEAIDLVDIDALVTQACLQYLPSVAAKLTAERVTCRFEDGVKYVKNCPKRYDIIIIDSTDPISVGEGLFTTEFYQACARILNPDGILVNQSESPFWQPREVAKIARKLRNVFPEVHFYQAHIPTYPSGHWAFGFATQKYHPLQNFDGDRCAAIEPDLRYYNADIHRGAFALPTFFRRLVT